MPKFVTTARGISLNIEKLIMDAKRPLNYKEPAGTVVPMDKPKTSTAINMRGFMPAQSAKPVPVVEAGRPDVVTPVTNVVDPTQFHRPEDTRSLADLTMVKVDQTKSIRLKPGAKPAPGDGAALAEETLGQIENSLRGSAKKAPKGSVLDDLDGE